MRDFLIVFLLSVLKGLLCFKKTLVELPFSSHINISILLFELYYNLNTSISKIQVVFLSILVKT